MSAWFVWGSLGLYPLTGTKGYFVGSPAVDKAVIRLPKGWSNLSTPGFFEHAVCLFHNYTCAMYVLTRYIQYVQQLH